MAESIATVNQREFLPEGGTAVHAIVRRRDVERAEDMALDTASTEKTRIRS